MRFFICRSLDVINNLNIQTLLLGQTWDDISINQFCKLTRIKHYFILGENNDYYIMTILSGELTQRTRKIILYCNDDPNHSDRRGCRL